MLLELRILTVHDFTRDKRAHIKMAAFAVWPQLTREANRHFLVDEKIPILLLLN